MEGEERGMQVRRYGEGERKEKEKVSLIRERGEGG